MSDTITFRSLDLAEPLLEALEAEGYTTPTPIQARTIPVLRAGHDLVGQAQTGTGKTAAFALPALERLDLTDRATQVLVLAPTRELALQVSASFETYGAKLGGLRVLTIYGGQSYTPQLNGLRRGAHVVVGTPGRVIDHVKKGTLRLDALRTVVLDEADEMLRMGFIDDVEWILGQTPENRQIALFSATMPRPIFRIAERHLRQPQTVTVEVERPAAARIRQRSWIGNGHAKVDALVRILEVEDVDGVIAFVRTKAATVQLADALVARGFSASALSGDVAQAQRERTVTAFRNGGFDVLVATDVAARGLDVDRVSHVVNFDAPSDPGSYVHRIGRTGRAGRTGEALVFLHPREAGLVRQLERASAGKIERLVLPSIQDVNAKRVARFESRITGALEAAEFGFYRELLAEFSEREGVEPIAAAAALAVLLQEGRPLRVEPKAAPSPTRLDERRERGPARPHREAPGDLIVYRIEVGREHGAAPGNIVGAITGEGGIEGRAIGRIRIDHEHSTVELPADLPEETLKRIGRTFVAGRKLRIRPNARRAA